jgi:hypothetical protein
MHLPVKYGNIFTSDCAMNSPRISNRILWWKFGKYTPRRKAAPLLRFSTIAEKKH